MCTKSVFRHQFVLDLALSPKDLQCPHILFISLLHFRNIILKVIKRRKGFEMMGFMTVTLASSFALMCASFIKNQKDQKVFIDLNFSLNIITQVINLQTNIKMMRLQSVLTMTGAFVATQRHSPTSLSFCPSSFLHLALLWARQLLPFCLNYGRSKALVLLSSYCTPNLRFGVPADLGQAQRRS